MAAVAAAGLVLFNLFVIEGVRVTDPATVGVIVGCVPVVLAVAGPLLASRTVSPGSWRRRPWSPWAPPACNGPAAGSPSRAFCSHSARLAARPASRCSPRPNLEQLGPLAVATYACLFALPMLAASSLVVDGPYLPAPSGSAGHQCWFSTIGAATTWLLVVYRGSARAEPALRTVCSLRGASP